MDTEFRNSMKRGAAFCALALFTLIGSFMALAGAASAQSLLPPDVQAQPPTSNVAATRSASVPITWVLQNTNPEPLLSINSTIGQLSFQGPNGSGNMNIPAPVMHGEVAPGQTARMRETIIIPQSFLTRALQAGTRTIFVSRVFEIEVFPGQFTTLDGAAEINLTGSLGAGLQISRIDLRFQNEAVQIIVPQYHPPEVRLDLTYTGTGLVRLIWELADPRVTAAGGTPVFRILRQDRIRLGVGGFTRVKGPNLSADLTGLHVVRARILDGPLAGQAPVVRYFVKAAAPDGEDWWKRYIRPHNEGDGMVRVPVEPDEDSLVIEETTESEGTPPDGAPAEDNGEDAADGSENPGGGADSGNAAEGADGGEEAAPAGETGADEAADAAAEPDGASEEGPGGEEDAETDDGEGETGQE